MRRRPRASPPSTSSTGRRRRIEVFNRGRTAFQVTASSSVRGSACRLGRSGGGERRGHPGRDRLGAAPPGRRSVPVPAARLGGQRGRGRGRDVQSGRRGSGHRLRRIRRRDCVIEAAHHDRAVGGSGVEWRTIPNLGLFQSGVTAFPVTAPPQTLRAGRAAAGICGPPVRGGRGRGPNHIVADARLSRPWRPALSPCRSTTSRRRWSTSMPERPTPTGTGPSPTIAGCGRRGTGSPAPAVTWSASGWSDPGLVFQRPQVATAALPPSYLGPPESARR